MTKLATKWYTSWFDTKYYHILYKDRDYEEAEELMRNLINFLQLKKGAKILDLACGKGRHSIYLNKMGFKVTGADLSKNSIKEAKKHEREGLQFKVHDMCKPMNDKFDAVFNLFTSFGYFEDEDSNFQTLKAIKDELQPKGYGVIDFMNVNQVIRNLVPQEVKTVDGIDFHLERWVNEGFIFKNIDFTDEGEPYSFTERVKTLRLKDFKNYFDKAGLHLIDVFGDYQLNPFEEENSSRLILIFE